MTGRPRCIRSSALETIRAIQYPRQSNRSKLRDDGSNNAENADASKYAGYDAATVCFPTRLFSELEVRAFLMKKQIVIRGYKDLPVKALCEFGRFLRISEAEKYVNSSLWFALKKPRSELFSAFPEELSHRVQLGAKAALRHTELNENWINDERRGYFSGQTWHSSSLSADGHRSQRSWKARFI
ncbi:MAG: hypothetical protein JWR80_145 [Bradyrhizobium sp.]|nr:hypothetical protein [Bradyrhizobium sp.]